VSSWATLLLVVYVSLGLSRMAPAKAVRVGALITVMVVSFEMVKIGAGG
jgi:hypothetical protein